MPGQYRAIWTVTGGGTGYSVFHCDNAGDVSDAQQFVDAVGDFFTGLQSAMPNDVLINGDAELVNLGEDGTLAAVFPVTPFPAVTGSGAFNYSRAAGGRIDWSTGAIVGGRRLTGRTYIVPMIAAAFSDNGLLTPAALDQMQTAGDALIAASIAAGIPLKIWSKKNATSVVVSTCSVPPAGAILRSRRD